MPAAAGFSKTVKIVDLKARFFTMINIFVKYILNQKVLKSMNVAFVWTMFIPVKSSHHATTSFIANA